MAIEITIRHLVISEKLQQFAREKAEKMIEEFDSTEFVRIVLGKDGPFYVAEMLVQGGRQRNAESKHRDADMITAINGAVERAKTQLRKVIGKQHEVRA